MDVQAFEKIVRNSKFTLLRKRPTPLGTVLMAERYFNWHPEAMPEIPGPHWQTLWTIERNEAEVGQKLFFFFGVSAAERVEATMAVATEFMRNRAWAESREGRSIGA